MIEAVADLRTALRAAGSELVVRVGRPEEVLSQLLRRTGAGAVYCHSEVRSHVYTYTHAWFNLYYCISSTDAAASND